MFAVITLLLRAGVGECVSFLDERIHLEYLLSRAGGLDYASPIGSSTRG